MDTSQLLQRLQADTTSGATTLATLALDTLTSFTEQTPATPAFRPALLALAKAVIEAQPSMAVMFNLVSQALQACPSELPPAAARQRLQQVLTAFRHQLQHSMAALCQQVLTILPPQATILTYSNSGTVIAALQHAQAHGYVRRVLLSESRPAYDGREQAIALLNSHIAVEYGVDMALFAWLPEAHVVLVGADAVFPHGLVNKLGTHALAQVAHRHGIPVFSLCASSKFLPTAAASLLCIEDHPGHEIWPEAPETLRISNRYFDTTPLSLLRGIVSETTVYTPENLLSHLQQLPLDAALQQLLSQRATSDN